MKLGNSTASSQPSDESIQDDRAVRKVRARVLTGTGRSVREIWKMVGPEEHAVSTFHDDKGKPRVLVFGS